MTIYGWALHIPTSPKTCESRCFSAPVLFAFVWMCNNCKISIHRWKMNMRWKMRRTCEVWCRNELLTFIKEWKNVRILYTIENENRPLFIAVCKSDLRRYYHGQNLAFTNTNTPSTIITITATTTKTTDNMKTGYLIWGSVELISIKNMAIFQTY